jgi:hypothetical protein
MKFSSLTPANQALLQSLEVAGSKKRRTRARHKVQFRTDPKFRSPKGAAISVWEFLVSPYTPGNGMPPGAFRFLRRAEGSDVTWFWATHLHNSSGFRFEPITDIPSFKPVRQAAHEDTGERANAHTDSILDAHDIALQIKEASREAMEEQMEARLAD